MSKICRGLVGIGIPQKFLGGAKNRGLTSLFSTQARRGLGYDTGDEIQIEGVAVVMVGALGGVVVVALVMVWGRAGAVVVDRVGVRTAVMVVVEDKAKIEAEVEARVKIGAEGMVLVADSSD